ncbi:kinase-like protein [Athelia psychrophila]|uniref:Kinase-like protein n=1 Tax=Athelia psychrophila TaxID=1759441 RepID=A0A167WIH0_9AGAM|nr:kinase-like protein [Fibularhizoctonia sp. CBS 109695]
MPDGETCDWMVSKYDVEFGQEPIGTGGFAKVLIGRWKSKEVALKMFQSQEGVAPQPQVVREEIETWSKLRHPNILEFFAANVSDAEPFIVMAYMKNGNARDYLKSHPASDRIKMARRVSLRHRATAATISLSLQLHDASLGLSHLHESGITHGDIKAANILIDDAGRAVIADFGLSRVKTAIDSRTIAQSTAPKSTAQGSQYWRAPELFKGERPGLPCDVYSFGMTIYEVVPLSTSYSFNNTHTFIDPDR